MLTSDLSMHTHTHPAKLPFYWNKTTEQVGMGVLKSEGSDTHTLSFLPFLLSASVGRCFIVRIGRTVWVPALWEVALLFSNNNLFHL